MSLSDELAAFVVTTSFEDIPQETEAFTKHLASKIVAAMLYGEIDSHHFIWDMVKNPEIAQERRKVTVHEQADRAKALGSPD